MSASIIITVANCPQFIVCIFGKFKLINIKKARPKPVASTGIYSFVGYPNSAMKNIGLATNTDHTGKYLNSDLPTAHFKYICSNVPITKNDINIMFSIFRCSTF